MYLTTANGRVRHPLSGKVSDSWYCLHCNSAINGQQVADSLWHCPACKASPLDIFDTAYWLDDGDTPPIPIQESDIRQGPEPTIDIIDTRLKLELDTDSLLIKQFEHAPRFGQKRCDICGLRASGQSYVAHRVSSQILRPIT